MKSNFAPVLPALAALLAAAVLAACVAPEPQATDGSHLVIWPERQLLLSGDAGSGAVRVFHLIGERPVPVAVWHSPQRRRVLEIRIDRDCGGVWVRGDRGLELHAAESGAALGSHVAAASQASAGNRAPACAGGLALAAPSGG